MTIEEMCVQHNKSKKKAMKRCFFYIRRRFFVFARIVFSVTKTKLLAFDNVEHIGPTLALQ